MALTEIEDGMITDGILTTSKLNTTGTASSTTVLKGDFSWGTGASSSGKWDITDSAPGTPVAGDMWYTGGVVYVAVATANTVGIWSMGNSLLTLREQNTGTGTLTASLSCCGTTPAATYTGTSETYDGSTWSAITDTPTGRSEMPGGAGTTSAGLVFGGVGPSAGDNTQEWSGSAWATGGTIGSAAGQGGATYGCGTQTAALKMAGETTPTPWTKSGEYDGTSWSTGGTLNTVRRWNAGAGVQTAAVTFGGRGNGSPLYQTSTEEYDGTTWTSALNMITGVQEGGGCGLQTAALSIGGKTAASTSHSTQAQEYDGTSWSLTGKLLNTTKYNAAGTGSTSAAQTNGGNDGSISRMTQEYNKIGEFNAKDVGYS